MNRRFSEFFFINTIHFSAVKIKLFEKSLNQLNRQALHAQSLGFIHPTNHKLLNFNSDLPKDFKKMLDLLNKLSH